MQDSKFFVEGTDFIYASHSAGVAVCRQESGCVNTQHCGSFPAVEKNKVDRKRQGSTSSSV